MLARIDSRELSEWQAYDAIDPFGERRADLRMGITCAAVLAPHTKRDKVPRPNDFMPKFQPPEPADPDTIKFKLMGHTIANGGKISPAKKV